MIRTGDLIFVKGHGVVSELIDWAENGEYSHVAIYAGYGQVLEAQGGRKIGYRPLSDYACYYKVGHIEATMEQRKRVLERAKSRIGEKYGWRLIWVLFLKLVLHIHEPYRNKYGVVCSKYAAWAWESEKKLTNNDEPTPQDLADSAYVSIE